MILSRASKLLPCHTGFVRKASPPSPADAEALESFLLGKRSASVALLKAEGLAAYAYTRQPEVADFKMAFISASARHLALKIELLHLLRAWLEAGIRVLLFKGFYLAEFVYEQPGQRLYSDVDLLMPAEESARAAQLAQQHGWHELWRQDHADDLYHLRGSRYRGHEVLQLLHPKLKVTLDVHSRLVHNNHNHISSNRRQARMTRQAWALATECLWEDVPVLHLNPADSVLIGLILNRCWSGDDWQLRPHDYLDFAALVEHGQLTLSALTERAHELGCSRTLALFLERCNPFEHHLDLTLPSLADKQRWNFQVMPERGNRYLERWLIEGTQLPRQAWDIVRALPLARRMVRLLCTHRPADILPSLELAGTEPTPLSHRQWQGLKQGVHRSLCLLGTDPETRREATALALYAALRARGYAVTLQVSERSPEKAAEFRLEMAGKVLNLSGTDLTRPNNTIPTR